tara:strand:+ start:55 stop:468 length:414 start_codon:yes stop_codon:yes gene_type:complete
MKKFFSKIKKRKLLHVVFRPNKKNQRINVTENREFLQFSCLNLNKKDKFLPHKHFWKKNKKKKKIVQESWLLVKGSAKVVFYDLNDKVLARKTLKPGDISITFEGGHKLEILKNNTIIYEHKTGPYEGRKKDLIHIN